MCKLPYVLDVVIDVFVKKCGFIGCVVAILKSVKVCMFLIACFPRYKRSSKGENYDF